MSDIDEQYQAAAAERRTHDQVSAPSADKLEAKLAACILSGDHLMNLFATPGEDEPVYCAKCGWRAVMR